MSGFRFPDESPGMRNSQFTDEQIIGFLEQVEVGAVVKYLGRSAG